MSAAENFLKSFEEAQNSGKWMAAVWVVDDGKITLTNLQTSKFPRGDYLRAVSQLAGLCADDVRAADAEKVTPPPEALPPGPLPRAIPDIKVFPSIEKAIVPPGFPEPALLSPEEIKRRKVVVDRSSDVAVVIFAEGSLPVALPIEATELQISKAVELYKSGLGASQ